MQAYYVDEYLISWEVIVRNAPSKLRWPVSHGPFRAEDEALYWALQNLESVPVAGR